MVKTTVYLDDETAIALKCLAQRTNTSQAELIRAELRKFVADNPPPLPKGMGMFSSGRSDISTSYRKLLKQAVRERRWP
jgi:uncharacterized protein (DUF1800 family)